MTQRLIKTAILLAIGVFLYTRIVGDTVLFYINQRFVALTLLASVGFILVGASLLLGSRDHDHDHDHEHSHESGRFAWLGLLILSIPVVVGFLVPPQPLGANALENREVDIGGFSSIAPPRNSETRMGILSGERNILDWLHEFQAEPDPNAYLDQEAHVIGFVYRDERFSSEQFMVSRFIVSCCVADAAPVGLIVQTSEAAELADDQWIEVTGLFQSGQFDGIELPVLLADEIILTEPPPQPYLYP